MAYHDPRIEEITASLWLVVYRLNCPDQPEAGSARRTMIAATWSELESAVTMVRIVRTASEARAVRLWAMIPAQEARAMNVLSRATIEGATAGAVIGTILLTGGQLQTPDRASAQTQRESVAEVVKAKRFEVIDADGKVGARLEGNTLTLMGSGESLVELNPFLGLELSDRFGAANLSARSLAMKDKKGLPGQWWEIRMKVAHDHIELTDRDGKTRAILGASQLRITQTEEVRQRPESSLVFFNSEGRVIWSAP